MAILSSNAALCEDAARLVARMVRPDSVRRLALRGMRAALSVARPVAKLSSGQRLGPRKDAGPAALEELDHRLWRDIGLEPPVPRSQGSAPVWWHGGLGGWS